MFQHGRDSSLISISGSFNDNCSIGSSSGSPRSSPYVSPRGSPRESLNQQFASSMSLQPPNASKASNNNSSGNNGSNNNTFVHKLYNMVADKQYQHLIAWDYTGWTFIVAGITEFSRDVLPKHFKHNNFSSFVRQLNMYGFHKVNKSPRGHRTLAENQIWQFSHNKFIKDRPELLDEIKRKSLETADTHKNNSAQHGDMNSHLAMMQLSQTKMMQQLARLQDNFNQVVRELSETREKQNKQHELLSKMMNFLSSKQQEKEQQQPQELNMDNFMDMIPPEPPQQIERPPSIFITSHDVTTYINHNNNRNNRNQSSLTVQTHNLDNMQQLVGDHSPALSAYHTALNTPVSPSPSQQIISDDDIPALSFNNSPLTPQSTYNFQPNLAFVPVPSHTFHHHHTNNHHHQ